MDSDQVTGIVIVFITVGLPILAMTLIKLAKIMKGETPSGKHGRNAADQDEARIMQELHRGMKRLEQRIESLETIIIDNEKQKTPDA